MTPLEQGAALRDEMVAALLGVDGWRQVGRAIPSYFQPAARTLLGELLWLQYGDRGPASIVLSDDAQVDVDLGVDLALHANGVGLLITTLSGDGVPADQVLLLNEGFRHLRRAWAGQALPTRMRWHGTDAPVQIFGAHGVDGTDDARSAFCDNGWVAQLLSPLTRTGTRWDVHPLADPRAFVHGWMSVARRNVEPYWLPMVWVDRMGECSADTDALTWAALRDGVEYRRWWSAGTRFGASRYSFVCLTHDWSGFAFTRSHMRGMYRDLVCIQLLRRTRLQAMQDASVALSKQMDERGAARWRAHDAAVNLRAHLLRYATAQDIAEPSHQDQGIELGALIAERLALHRTHQSLHREVERAERWLAEEQQKRLASRVGQLTMVLAFIGVWAGFAGANQPDQGLLAWHGGGPGAPFPPGVFGFIVINLVAAFILIALLGLVAWVVDSVRGLR